MPHQCHRAGLRSWGCCCHQGCQPVPIQAATHPSTGMATLNHQDPLALPTLHHAQITLPAPPRSTRIFIAPDSSLIKQNNRHCHRNPVPDEAMLAAALGMGRGLPWHPNPWGWLGAPPAGAGGPHGATQCHRGLHPSAWGAVAGLAGCQCHQAAVPETPVRVSLPAPGSVQPW